MVEAHGRGKLEEVWGTGTAAVISPVGELAYKGEKMVINGGKIGALTQKLYDAIVAIQYGQAPDPDGWTLDDLREAPDDRLRVLQDPRRPDSLDEDLRGRADARVHGHQPPQLRATAW